MSGMTCPTFTAALETFRERHLAHADADPESPAGQYLLGLSDAYADAAGLLEQLGCAAWPAQTAGDPFQLPFPRRERNREETA